MRCGGRPSPRGSRIGLQRRRVGPRPPVARSRFVRRRRRATLAAALQCTAVMAAALSTTIPPRPSRVGVDDVSQRCKLSLLFDLTVTGVKCAASCQKLVLMTPLGARCDKMDDDDVLYDAHAPRSHLFIPVFKLLFER